MAKDAKKAAAIASTTTSAGALEFLAGLDVGELEQAINEKRKELDALEVLQRAAIVRRDGAPRKGPRRKAAETGGGASELSPADEEARLDLRAKLVDALTGRSSARIDHLADELKAEKGELVAVMENDEAFERRGPAYWALSEQE
jgi:hypothetical protein